MNLYLCEKPSQARDIARVLGAGSKGEGCLRGAGIAVTWCFGHLLEMVPPEGYGEQYKRWSLDTLPIVPEQWRLAVRADARAQVAAIRALLAEASSVVVATDADREGETIARELLAHLRWRGPVSRLWLSALDEASIRKALASIRPGESTLALYYAGLGRARADWLVGMNLTRAFTVLGRDAGHSGVLSVGRVQTPTLRIVVDRDREIEGFVSRPFWEVVGEFAAPGSGQAFRGKWLAPAAVSDPEGRCNSEQAARQVAQQVLGQLAVVVLAQQERRKEPPPLPFDLGTLQQEASRRLGMGAKEVLDAAQALYETHKATTYPRTDCGYLPQSMRSDVPQVMAALVRSDPAMRDLVQGADLHRQGRCWNDGKITAHHAIIPTTAPCDLGRMSQAQRRVYDLVRLRYLAQFYPDHEFDQSSAELRVQGERFRAGGREVVVQGWRSLFADAAKGAGETTDEMPSDEAADQAMPALSQDDRCPVRGARVLARETRPPARYTEGTLIAAMKGASRFVSDPKLRAMLRETSGLGTEATRAGIIETLLGRGFLSKSKRHLVSTPTGRALIDAVPDAVKDPGTTALWEQALDDVAQGRGDLRQFIERQSQWVVQLVQGARESGARAVPAGAAAPGCPECGRPLQRRRGAKGFFWGCTGYPDCKATFPDANGKPGARAPAKAGAAGPSEAGGPCPDCGKGHLVTRTFKDGRNADRSYLGCSRFPDCRFFSWQPGGKAG